MKRHTTGAYIASAAEKRPKSQGPCCPEPLAGVVPDGHDAVDIGLHRGARRGAREAQLDVHRIGTAQRTGIRHASRRRCCGPGRAPAHARARSAGSARQGTRQSPATPTPGNHRHAGGHEPIAGIWAMRIADPRPVTSTMRSSKGMPKCVSSSHARGTTRSNSCCRSKRYIREPPVRVRRDGLPT